MDADVDHGAAALEGFLAEDAPVGDTTSAECVDFAVEDVAEDACIDLFFDELCARVESPLVCDDEFFVCFLCGSDHTFAFASVHGHGFFRP